MAHSIRCANVKLQNFITVYRRLSSQVTSELYETNNRNKDAENKELQLSLLTEFTRKFNIIKLLSRWYSVKITESKGDDNQVVQYDFDLSLPVKENVTPGYTYLHWGNVGSLASSNQQSPNHLAENSSMSFSLVSTNSIFHNIGESEKKSANIITDWLTDTGTSTLHDCSSFYSSNANISSVKKYSVHKLFDDTHYDSTNISSNSEDDIILRDVEDFKIRVEKSVLDSPLEIVDDAKASSVLKTSLERVNHDEIDSILPTDIKSGVKSIDNGGNYIENPTVLQFSNTIVDQKSDDRETNPRDPPRNSGPSKEQVVFIKDFLLEELPKFFHRRRRLEVYHKDIIFENNFFEKPVTSHGLPKYVANIIKIRTLAHLQYASIGVNILSVSTHEEGLVKIRWQVMALSQFKAFKFWKLLPHVYAKNRIAMSTRFDGFSTFTVGSDGLIHKHKVDRVIPNEEEVKVHKDKLSPAVSV